MYVSDARKEFVLQLMVQCGVGIDQWTPELISKVTITANALADGIASEDCMGTSKQYAIDETTIIFGGEVGDDIAWGCAALANGAGRQSSLKDLGAGTTARSDRFHYRIKSDGWQATPAIPNTLDIHIKTSDGTTPDNDDGLTDAAVSAIDKLLNLDFIDEIVCDEAAANIPAATEGYLFIPQRHVGFVAWNRGGSALKNSTASVKLYLTPRPLQQQAS